MTEDAFAATYSDWKVIKGRKVVQLVFELPLEKADEAYQVLGGMPIAAHEVWCGIARMNVKGGDATEPGNSNRSHLSTTPETQPRSSAAQKAGADKERRPFGTLPYSAQAAMRGEDVIFRAFLREACGKVKVTDANAARLAIYQICGVSSRAAILPGTEAETYWLDLERSFSSWLAAERSMA